MPVPKVVRSINELFNALNDRVRRLELGTSQIGAWSIVEDRTTGDLTAVRNNGQGTTPTVVVIAPK